MDENFPAFTICPPDDGKWGLATTAMKIVDSRNSNAGILDLFANNQLLLIELSRVIWQQAQLKVNGIGILILKLLLIIIQHNQPFAGCQERN